MDQSFADIVDRHFRDVVAPALQRVADAVGTEFAPSLSVIQKDGPTQPPDDSIVNGNRRVILRVEDVVELWFVAWDPFVLIQNRRGQVGSPPRLHTLGQLTPNDVRGMATKFLSGVRAPAMP
jgi:hypothetical protein